MANRKIKLALLSLPNGLDFGFKMVENGCFIGNKPVEFENNTLVIDNEKYTLTVGLLNLLTKERPMGYSNTELDKYKEILLLSSAHRRGFNSKNHINSSRSWKYTNIISKLFPPKRTYLKKSRGSMIKKNLKLNSTIPPTLNDLELDYDNDVNKLVEMFKQLESDNFNHKNDDKIWSILLELEKLGIIEF